LSTSTELHGAVAGRHRLVYVGQARWAAAVVATTRPVRGNLFPAPSGDLPRSPATAVHRLHGRPVWRRAGQGVSVSGVRPSRSPIQPRAYRGDGRVAVYTRGSHSGASAPAAVQPSESDIGHRRKELTCCVTRSPCRTAKAWSSRSGMAPSPTRKSRWWTPQRDAHHAGTWHVRRYASSAPRLYAADASWSLYLRPITLALTGPETRCSRGSW